MKRFIVAMAVGGLTLAPTALAQNDAVVDAYGGKGAPVVGVTEVLGAAETGGGGAGGTVNGESVAGTPSGTAGVSESGPAGAAPVATASAPEAVPSGSLPFTGLDIALIAAGGLLLLGLGFGMRHLSSHSTAH